MSLTIKRSDSVTSILLFIFNVFLSGKGINAVSIKKILRLLEPFDKSETSIRMGLSRGLQKGLLTSFKKDNEVYYQITEDAVNSFAYWWKVTQRFQERISLQQQDWNGVWCIIYNSGSSGEVSSMLDDYGYGMLKKHLFISPYDYNDQIAPLVRKYNTQDSIYMFKTNNFTDKTTKDIVNNAWKIKELALMYDEYVTELNDVCSELRDKDSNKGEGLPILHLFGLKLFNILQIDPQLPMQLLPASWSGVLAYTKFNTIREILLPKANSFINHILSDSIT